MVVLNEAVAEKGRVYVTTGQLEASRMSRNHTRII